MRKAQRYLAGLFTLVLAVTLMPAAAFSDTRIKQKKQSDAFNVMGSEMPAQEQVLTTWMGKDWARTDEGDARSIIVRLDKNTFYFLHHQGRTYTEMAIGAITDMMTQALAESQTDLTEEEKAQAAEFMKEVTSSMIQIKAAVTVTDEKKKFGKWNARLYKLKVEMPMGSSSSEIWASEEIGVDMGLFNRLGNALLMKEPSFQEALKEMEKIKGFPVYRVDVSEAMGTQMRSTQELLEVEETEPPAGNYEVPEGYSRGRGM